MRRAWACECENATAARDRSATILAASRDLDVDDTPNNARRDSYGVAREAGDRLADEAREVRVRIVPQRASTQLESPRPIAAVRTVDEAGIGERDEDAPDRHLVEALSLESLGDLGVAHRAFGLTELAEHRQPAGRHLELGLTKLLSQGRVRRLPRRF